MSTENISLSLKLSKCKFALLTDSQLNSNAILIIYDLTYDVQTKCQQCVIRKNFVIITQLSFLRQG